MRVLHVAAGNLYGGVERILEEIARHGNGRHHFALSFTGRLSASLASASATVHDLGPVRFSRPLSVWRARWRLRRVLRSHGYDAVIGHSPWAYALAAPVALRSGTRRVLWAHDALDGRHWTEHHVARHPPDFVICNSRYTARAVGAWLVSPRTEVIYAPVAASPGSAAIRSQVRHELGVSEGTTVILLASRLERWKGHSELLRATSALGGDWAIWIAGGAQRPHETRYEKELRQLASSLPTAARIHLLGARSDVDRLLHGADVLCQPNTAPEPFGLVFVEALYAGVPVVTSDAGGAREIVTAECGVLVAPGDRAALSAELQSLVDNPARRRGLGSAGPARARTLCDPATQMAALERAIA